MSALRQQPVSIAIEKNDQYSFHLLKTGVLTLCVIRSLTMASNRRSRRRSTRVFVARSSADGSHHGLSAGKAATAEDNLWQVRASVFPSLYLQRAGNSKRRTCSSRCGLDLRCPVCPDVV